MEEATEETIQQFSDAIEQDVHQVLSWQQMVETVQLEDNIYANTEQLSSDPPAQETEVEDHVGLNIDTLFQDPGSLGLQLKLDLQIGISRHSNNQISRILYLTFGQNRSNTIYRLRFLAFFNLVLHVIVGVPYLLEFLHGVHVTYLVMFIITVGVPISVAVISLLVSYWHLSDLGSDERSNLITGLLVANLFMFGCRLDFNWVPTRGTGN